MSEASRTTAGRQAGEATVRRIGPAELRDALARGLADFQAKPSHVLLLVVLYPVLGLLLSRIAAGYNVLPLVFPLISGFALVGPIAALGLYELSRRREAGQRIAWRDAFNVVRSPSIGAIATLSGLLALIYLVWLAAAYALYRLIFGDAVPESVGGFARDVLTTSQGWTLIILGCGVGFLFALLVLAIGSVSFPMLVDRNVSAAAAVRTSVAVFRANPAALALWGLIVAVALVLGSIPAFLGLVIAMPVLGHATWHLYRKAVAP